MDPRPYQLSTNIYSSFQILYDFGLASEKRADQRDNLRK